MAETIVPPFCLSLGVPSGSCLHFMAGVDLVTSSALPTVIHGASLTETVSVFQTLKKCQRLNSCVASPLCGIWAFPYVRNFTVIPFPFLAAGPGVGCCVRRGAFPSGSPEAS